MIEKQPVVAIIVVTRDKEINFKVAGLYL